MCATNVDTRIIDYHIKLEEIRLYIFKNQEITNILSLSSYRTFPQI